MRSIMPCRSFSMAAVEGNKVTEGGTHLTLNSLPGGGLISVQIPFIYALTQVIKRNLFPIQRRVTGTRGISDKSLFAAASRAQLIRRQGHL